MFVLIHSQGWKQKGQAPGGLPRFHSSSCASPLPLIYHENRPLIYRERAQAAQRCNQENLIEQLKNGVRGLHAPVNTLNANWAYMVMASLAWSLKAWMALMLPVCPRWRDKHLREKQLILRMEFRTFLNAFIAVPCQIITRGRQIIYRLLSWNPWQHVFFRMLDALET